MSKKYRLFISHSWKYTGAYKKIIKFLEQENIEFYNHSVPQDRPVDTNGTAKQLREALDAKIKNTSCVLIIAGKYATYSKWINHPIKNSLIE